jgi:hypothetical protein
MSEKDFLKVQVFSPTPGPSPNRGGEKCAKKGLRGRCAPTAALFSLLIHYEIGQGGGKAMECFDFEKALRVRRGTLDFLSFLC